MIDVVQAFAERLEQQCGHLFAKVGQIADFEAMQDMPRLVPVAYVLPRGESASASASIKGSSTQEHTLGIQVVYITRHAGDPTGAKAVTALHPLREAVHDSLVGWVPPNCSGHRVDFQSGQLAGVEAGTSVWQDDFQVRRLVRRAPIN